MRLLLLGLTAVGLSLPASRGADRDPILLDLEKSKEAHTQAMTKARSALLTAFDDAIKAAAQTGDLDLVKGIRAERKAFEDTGKLPTSIKMGIAAGEHQKATRTARFALDKAYEQAIKDATKALKIDLAEAIREDWNVLKAIGSKAKTPATTPPKADPPAPKEKIVAGTYAVRYTPNRSERTYLVRGDGSVLTPEGKLVGQLKADGGAYLLDFGDNRMERLTFTDGRVFVEHFNPKADFARNWPAQIGIGELAKKK